jgi:hypothetical protein
MLTIDSFREQFLQLTAGWSWEVRGFLDSQGYVHPIDTDTKVISTVFERLSAPAIRSIARDAGYIVETANQTTYPDFTLSAYSRAGDLLHRIALDIKTTYASSRMVFTLGGYTSFLVKPTKNILYSYDSYGAHWVLGFIYSRNPAFREYDLDSMPQANEIACPYRDVSMFIRDKHEIVGLRAGSGNTANIGSILARNPTEFLNALGPFSKFSFGKEACDHYWARYKEYCSQIASEEDLLQHPDFQRYR